LANKLVHLASAYKSSTYFFTLDLHYRDSLSFDVGKHNDTMKSYFNLQKILLLTIIFVLSACSSLVPKEHLIPKEKLTTTLQNKFPILHQEAGGLFNILIESPQLNLIPEQNRLSIKAHYIANATILELTGDFAFSGKLKYDAEKRDIFLSDAKFDSLQLAGGFLDEKIRNKLNVKISEFAQQTPIYTFKPDELTFLGTQLEISSIDVVNDGILLKLHPLK